MLAGLVLAGSGSASAQAVRIVAGPIEPASWEGEQPKRRQNERMDGARYLALYGTAFLGTPVSLEGLPDAPAGFHYPTVHFLFSAAARPRPAGGEVAVARGLQRLNAHVRIEPLDSAQQPIAELAGLEVLGTFPDAILMASLERDTTTTRTSVGGAAFTTLTRALLPAVPGMLGKRVGPLVTSFTKVFHRPSGPTQVAYLSEHREFGWTWYAHGDSSLEGTHRASAVLEISSTVRYLRVQILMLADWSAHGAWQRALEVTLDVGAGTSTRPSTPAN